MVINGDTTTLSEVSTYTRAGRGILVVATETGGLAAALADFVLTGNVPSDWRGHEKAFAELKALNGEAAKRGMDAGGNGWPLIALADDMTKRGITDAILDAAMRQAEDLRTRVRFSVEWHDAERLQSELARIPHWESSRQLILRDRLQLALELQNERCVDVFRRNAAPIKMIDLLENR